MYTTEHSNLFPSMYILLVRQTLNVIHIYNVYQSVHEHTHVPKANITGTINVPKI